MRWYQDWFGKFRASCEIGLQADVRVFILCSLLLLQKCKEEKCLWCAISSLSGPLLWEKVTFFRCDQKRERSKYRDIIKYTKDYFSFQNVWSYTLRDVGLIIYLFEFVIKKKGFAITPHLFHSMIYRIIFNLKSYILQIRWSLTCDLMHLNYYI